LSGPLSRAFLAAGGVASETDGAALERSLVERWEAGHAAWPTIALEPEAFAAHVATCSRAARALPPQEHAADLFLACACALGTPGAVVAFEKAYAGVLARSASRVDRANADETVQAVRVRLFVGTAERPARIADYGGRSKLSSWLSAVSARTALNGRRRKDDGSHESLSAVAASTPALPPEIAILRARHAGDFREAIRLALGRIEARDRSLLRMTLVVGLSLDQVGAVFKISRATTKRWLAAARDALQDETRKELAGRLGLTPSELESLAAVVRSEIDLSVRALLGETNA
jgi:RNA polymerase sigma-70 factor (ECF subfamily)